MENNQLSGKSKLNARLTKKIVKLKQEKKILIDKLEELGIDTDQLLNKRESNERKNQT
jgi:hypothetical protein